MSLEALEERYSPSELRRLRAEAEGLRERLVSGALRGRKRLRRRVTVGRTPLGECLRQLAEAQGQWEAAVKGGEEGSLRGEEAQVKLLNLLEKGLALVERVEVLREGPPKRRRSSRRKERARGAQGGGGGAGEEDPFNQEALPFRRMEGLLGDLPEGEPPGLAPQEETPPQGEGRRERAGGELGGEEGEEEGPGEEEGDHESDSEGGDIHEGDRDRGGNSGGEHQGGDEDQDDPVWEDRDEEEDSSGNTGEDGDEAQGDSEGKDSDQALREGPLKRRSSSSRRRKKGARAAQGGGGAAVEEDPLNQEALPFRRMEGLLGNLPEGEPPGLAPQEETPPREEGGRERAEGEQEGEEGEEEGDHGSDSEGGDTHRGDGDSSGNTGDEDPDGDEDEEDSEGEDSHEGDGDRGGNSGGERQDGDENQDDGEGEDRDEEKDKSVTCDDLLEWMDEVEQEVDALQDPSQEKADPLRREAEVLKDWYIDIRFDMAWALKDKVLHLWSALWLNPLQAVTALQEVLSQFSAVEVAVLKSESDSLERFLQAAQSEDTLAELSNFYCSLNALLKMGLSCGDLLKEGGAIKGEMDSWCSALLRVLLKEGQEKTNALQEKVDVVKDISPEQSGALKEKMGALQKQMGLLWKVPLKEMMGLLIMAYKLHYKLRSGPTKEENTIWKKTCDLAVALKVALKDVPQEEGGLLWGKVADLEAILHDTPVEKLVALEEKVKVCVRKVGVLQNKIWKSLDEELEFLKEKLDSLKDSSQKDLGELQEELHELEDKLLDLKVYDIYPLKGTVNALKKKMNALRKKMNVPQKAAGAPLKVGDEAMQVDRTGFLEMLDAQDAVPLSSPGLRKTWHREVTQEERCLLAQHFAKTISPDHDSEAAKKMLEVYAIQIEAEVYGLADSKTEYHRLMADKLNAMYGKLDETLRSPSSNYGIRRNEQPTLQGPWIQPPGVPSVAATTGKIQPPQLPSGAPRSAAQKRPPSELQAADNPSKTSQIQERTTLNRFQRLVPPQPEEATCVESSGESLAGCEPALTEGEGSEPPCKKQRTNPPDGTQEPSLTQELFAALQKHLTLTVNQNMKKVSDMVSRLHGAALKDTEEAKALTAALKKALALLRFLFKYA